MERPERVRRLIVNADDFGRSSAINAAVRHAHREGILTCASLMVNEPAAAEAVAIARSLPALGVGLHLALVDSCSASPHVSSSSSKTAKSRTTVEDERAPSSTRPGKNRLVNGRGRLPENPVLAGMRFFFDRRLRQPLETEIQAQVEKFHATGLALDHVNGHLNMHLHPTILRILLGNAARWGIKRIRLTRDPFFLNARLAPGRWFYRTSHALIYFLLAARARAAFRRAGIQHTRHVFGLLQSARVDEAFLGRLLPQLPAGDSELYSHPSLDVSKAELEALVSPHVRGRVKQLGIQLIRYQDL